MEELLIKYLTDYYKYFTNISIKHYNIEGSICEVHYYLDSSQYNVEKININVWEMLLFLYKK